MDAMETLRGQYLVAMPGMADERFVETVVFLVAHGEDGAMGLVVNKPMGDMHLSDILMEMELDAEARAIRVSEQRLEQDVLKGGPVDTSRGFVLHTPDYFRDGNSYLVGEEVCLTATLDVLRAIADGTGPAHSVLALGYCGWGAGQLEAELKQNGWLTLEHTPDLMFSVPAARRYDKALAMLGVSRANLSPYSGTA